MKNTCPWCLEPLPAHTADASCPHCGRPLDAEAEHNALELRFLKVEVTQRSNFRQLLTWGAPIAALIALVMPFLHIGAVAVVPVLVGVHLVVTRLLLARGAQKLLRPVRRLLGRWLARFAFLWIGIPGYGSMTVPIIGVLTGVATFVLLSSIVQVSTSWSLERERAGRPLALWETAIPVALAALTIALLIVSIVVLVALGWSVAAILDWVSPE